MKRLRRYNPRKVLAATAGLAAVSYLGTTGCSASSGNLVAPPDGTGATVSGGGGDAATGGVPGTGAWTSGNLVGPPTGGSTGGYTPGPCDEGQGGTPAEGGHGGEGGAAVLCQVK